MLTTAKRLLTDPEGFNIRAENIRLYGQDNNPEAYAVCQAEMLMLGDEPTHIKEGNTLTEDRFPGEVRPADHQPALRRGMENGKSLVEKELRQPTTVLWPARPASATGSCCSFKTCWPRRRMTRASRSSSTARRCSPETPAAGRARSGAMCWKTTCWRPSSPCRIRCFTTPAFIPISGSSPKRPIPGATTRSSSSTRRHSMCRRRRNPSKQAQVH